MKDRTRKPGITENAFGEIEEGDDEEFSGETLNIKSMATGGGEGGIQAATHPADF